MSIYDCLYMQVTDDDKQGDEGDDGQDYSLDATHDNNDDYVDAELQDFLNTDPLELDVLAQVVIMTSLYCVLATFLTSLHSWRLFRRMLGCYEGVVDD